MSGKGLSSWLLFQSHRTSELQPPARREPQFERLRSRRSVDSSAKFKVPSSKFRAKNERFPPLTAYCLPFTAYGLHLDDFNDFNGLNAFYAFYAFYDKNFLGELTTINRSNTREKNNVDFTLFYLDKHPFFGKMCSGLNIFSDLAGSCAHAFRRQSPTFQATTALLAYSP